MSLPRFGEQCEPSWESFLGGKTPESTHVGCPGGSNTPGLIGGWTCPCACHLIAPAQKADELDHKTRLRSDEPLVKTVARQVREQMGRNRHG